MTFDRAHSNSLSTTSLFPETEYLKDCLRRYFGLKKSSHQGRSRLSEGSADAIIEIARLNKIANFLDVSRPPQRTGSGKRARQELDSLRKKTFLQNSRVIATTGEICKALQQAGLDFTLMKGPLQQNLLYRNCYMKPVGDIDILVSPEGFKSALKALSRTGYEIAEVSRSLWWSHFLAEQHLVFSGQGTAVVADLHHSVRQPGTPGIRRTMHILQRKDLVNLGSTKVPFLSHSDILLVACINIAKALYNREPCAGYACDAFAASRIMNIVEHDRLAEYARSHQLFGTLLLGFRVAGVVVGKDNWRLCDKAEGFLPAIGDDELCQMVFTPWLRSIRWPKRRSVLWELCSRKPVHFATESGWAITSEVARRLFERNKATGHRASKAAVPDLPVNDRKSENPAA